MKPKYQFSIKSGELGTNTYVWRVRPYGCDAWMLIDDLDKFIMDLENHINEGDFLEVQLVEISREELASLPEFPGW
jgi:hypothetical protein